MRNHFDCGNFGPSFRGDSFDFGHQATLFSLSRAHGRHWHGYRRHVYEYHGPEPHGNGPHGNRQHCHGPHDHVPFCNKLRGQGHHGHGPHHSRLRGQRLHGHGPHDNGYHCYRPHGFGPHLGNQTCPPNRLWKIFSDQKRLLFSGPHQYRRGHREEWKQGSHRAHHANLHNITLRPHSV